jgi:hypothetical protein
MSKVDRSQNATPHPPTATRKRHETKIDPKRVGSFVNEIFGPTEHAKRVQSLANAVVGITHAAVLGIHAIGQAYAQIAGITGKSGVKQIDRLLSSSNMVLDCLLKAWVTFVVGIRTEIVVALDWTEFDNDKQTTLAAFLVTDHGRATPLIWKTHDKSTLKSNQKRYEQELIEQLHGWLDPNVRITLLADRGFGDQALYDLVMFLGWDFVIRFRGNVIVTAMDGESKTAQQWVWPKGRQTASCCGTYRCPTARTTAMATARPPHRRSGISTATGSWRSSCRPSSTVWTCSAFRDRGRIACCGPRHGVDHFGWASRTGCEAGPGPSYVGNDTRDAARGRGRGRMCPSQYR